MSKKYDEFLKDLEELCRKHNVRLKQTYDEIQLRDIGSDEEAAVDALIQDYTTEDPRG